MPTRKELEGMLRKASAAYRDTSNPQLQAQAAADLPELERMYNEAPEDAPELGFSGRPKVPVDAQGNIINPGGRIPTPGKRESALTGNPILDTLAGAGETWDSTWRGIKQIAASDPEEIKRLEQEELAARETNTELDESAAGKVGKFLGYGSQVVVPAMLAAAAPAAVGLGGAGVMGGLATAGAEGLAGAGLASLEPVAGDESRATNAAWGGTINAIIPGASKFVSRLPLVSHLLRTDPVSESLSKQATAAATKARVTALKEQSGKRIGELSRQAVVDLSPHVKRMKQVRHLFGDAMDQSVAGTKRGLGELINTGQRSSTILKDQVQMLRTAALENAKAAKGQAKTGFQAMRRVIDQAIDAGLPTKKAVKEMRKVRTIHRTAQDIAEAEVRKQAAKVEALKAAARLTAGGEAERFISH